MRTRVSVWVAAVAVCFMLGAGVAHADGSYDDWGSDGIDSNQLRISVSETPYAYQNTVLRAVREYAALRVAEGYPWQAAATFNDDSIGHRDKDVFNLFLGYERPVSDKLSWGLQSVEQYGSVYKDNALWYEGVTGYVNYDVTDALRVGGYANGNYAWSDLRDVDNELSFAGGGYASYLLKVSDRIVLTPAAVYQHYEAGQDSFEDSDLFSVGGRVDFGITDRIQANFEFFYNAEATNDFVDDSFWGWRVGAAYSITDGWAISGSLGGTEDFKDYDSTEFTVGLRATF